LDAGDTTPPDEFDVHLHVAANTEYLEVGEFAYANGVVTPSGRTHLRGEGWSGFTHN